MIVQIDPGSVGSKGKGGERDDLALAAHDDKD